MQQISRLARATMLLSVYIQHPQSVPDILTPKAILDDICAPPRELYRLLNPMFLQIMTKILAQYLLDPESFARAIHSFFSDEPTDLVFFAYATFPSLFSFFYIPDLVGNAIQLVFELMNIDPGDIAAHFAAALYVSFPRFADSLWSTFFKKVRRKEGEVWEVFLKALGIACRFLSAFHCDLARRIWKLGRAVFVHIFIDFLLMPSLKVHLDCDVSSHFLNGHCELLQNFKELRIQPDSDRLTQIWSVMSSESVVEPEYSIYGGYSGMSLKLYPTSLSAYELRILFGIITGSQTKHPDAEKAMKLCRPATFTTFRSGELEIFNTFSAAQPVTIYHFIQRTGPPLPDLPDNPEYIRCFGMISDYAKRQRLDILSVIEPELFPGSAASSDRLNGRMSILSDCSFKLYAVVQMLKHTAHCFATFEEDLTMQQYDRQYQIVGAHAQHQYDIFLNSFVRRFGTFGNESLDFRLTVFEPQTITPCTFSVPTYPPITQPIVLREIALLRTEVCAFLAMETAERVIAIAQLLAEAWAMEERTGHPGIVAAVLREVLGGEQRPGLLEAFSHFAVIRFPSEPALALSLKRIWDRLQSMLT
jgi:hypothetical protein